nr:hypothetical protein [Tanacetum cinerariifolium]
TTILSIILENLPTFNSAFRFNERLRSLETTFSEYRQTNPFVDVVSAIPDEKRNLYKALVEAYDADKVILDTYGESTILKRRREDDDQEGPSAGSDRGSKRQREGGEHASASTPSETATGSAGGSTIGSQSRQLSANYGHTKWIDDLVPRAMWIQEPINYDRHALWGVSHWGRKRQQFYGFAVNRESGLDVYSKRRIITVIELKIVEWHNYKHLDWTLVCRDDDKIYKFKEIDFKRLRLQDIEDMPLLLVQGKPSNLTVEERFAFYVSLKMFTVGNKMHKAFPLPG